jgi:hypothetical protein
VTWREAPLYVEAHDLTRWVIELARTWGDRDAGPLAARVVDAACALLEAVSLALTFPSGRALDLEEADRSIVRLRVLLRVAHELGLLSPSALRFACGQLQTAGKMVGGWRKRVDKHDSFAEQYSGDGPPAAAGA